MEVSAPAIFCPRLPRLPENESMLLPFQEGEVNKASKEEGKKSQQEKLCTIIRLNDLLRCAGLFRSYNELLPEFGNSVSVWHSGDLVLHFHKVK